jgi:putative endonuclease
LLLSLSLWPYTKPIILSRCLALSNPPKPVILSGAACALCKLRSRRTPKVYTHHDLQTFFTTEFKGINMKSGYTYIMGSPTGTLYIGVTSEIYTRVQQHKNGIFEGFSKEHNCTRLLYYEQQEDITQSIAREKQLKGWRREKKLNLIRTHNPDFKDLAETWGWKLITANEQMNP